MPKWKTNILLCAILFPANVPQAGAVLEGALRIKLDSFINLYISGDYRKAIDSLDLFLPQIAATEQGVDAYKYLGFSYCMVDKLDSAKDCFKTALQKFPHMELDTLEVPPNIALVFNQAVLERKVERLTLASRKMPVVANPERNTAIPAIVLATSILSGTAAGYFFYNGYGYHQKYLSITGPDQRELDNYYNLSRTAYIDGAVFVGITLILLPVSIYLFNRKIPAQVSIILPVIDGQPSPAITLQHDL